MSFHLPFFAADSITVLLIHRRQPRPRPSPADG
jgi:hypothetical protein